MSKYQYIIFSKLKFLMTISGFLLPTLALSQDFSLTPINGSISLSPGFVPDPHTITVSAGGNLNASNASSECVGYVSDAPNYRLNFEPGGNGLGIYINADFDSTLVINDPFGNWYCGDDYPVLGNDAGWYFDNPNSGRYDIWVGVYSESDSSRSAVLAITEYSDIIWETDLTPAIRPKK